VPDLVRIVVAIDPATTSGEDADETGIIVAGKDGGGRGYVLADRSGHYTPTEWAQLAIALYRQHKADRIVAEVNNGGAHMTLLGGFHNARARGRGNMAGGLVERWHYVRIVRGQGWTHVEGRAVAD
jgi:phage terminase large subunit-like protein